MSAEKTNNNLKSIIGKVADAIKTRTLASEYPKIHRLCRQKSISSYTLNVLISHILSNSGECDVVDKSFFVIDKNIVLPSEEKEEKKEKLKMQGKIQKLEGRVQVLLKIIEEKTQRAKDIKAQMEVLKKQKIRRVWPYWVAISVMCLLLVCLIYFVISNPQMVYEMERTVRDIFKW